MKNISPKVFHLDIYLKHVIKCRDFPAGTVWISRSWFKDMLICLESEMSRDAVKITSTVWPWNWAKAAFVKRCHGASSGACWKFLNATVIQIFFFLTATDGFGRFVFLTPKKWKVKKTKTWKCVEHFIISWCSTVFWVAILQSSPFRRCSCWWITCLDVGGVLHFGCTFLFGTFWVDKSKNCVLFFAG